MNRASLIFVLLLGALAAGCPKPLTPDQRLAKAAPAPTRSLLEAAGDAAAVVLVVHPDRWPAAARSLQPFFAGGSSPAAVGAVLSAPDLWSALGRLATIGTSGARWPARLAGWDPTRPIVIALFEPELNETIRAARVVMPMEPGAHVPPIHHRVLVPATDARALLDSLDAVSGSFNWRALPFGGELAGLKGGRIYQTSSGGLAALVPETDHLRIEIAQGTYSPNGSPEVMQQAMTAWLARPPARVTGPVTPAMLFAASRTDLLVAHVRPWALRDLNSQLGVGMVFSALVGVDPHIRQELMITGLSEVAGGSLLMTPRGAEFDDWALSLDLDAGLHLAGVASLTERGQAVWRAGQTDGLPPLAAAEGPALVEMALSVDTQAMLAAAEVPVGLREAKAASEIFEATARCGYMCSLHYLLRQPVGLLKVLNDRVDEETRIHLPRAMAMRLVAIEPGSGPVPIRLAVAASFSAGTDTRWLRKLMAGLGQQAQVDLFTDRLGEAEITRLGIGVDPRRVFELKPAGLAVGQVFRYSVGTDTLANLLTRYSPAGAAALDKLGQISARAWLVERALVGEMDVPLEGAPPHPPLRLPDMDGLAWASPGLAAASTKGAACLEEVTRGLIESLHGLAYAAESERAAILAKVAEELQAPLACALAAPDTRADAGRVQLSLALMEAERLERAWKRAEQIQVLDDACGQGHQRACHLADAARAGPKVELVTTKGGCLEAWHEGESVVRVGAAEPDKDRIVAQVRGDAVQPVPLLALDGGLRGDSLSSLGLALQASKVHRVGFLVRSPERGLARIPIELGLAPKQNAEVAKSAAPEVIARSDPFKPLDLAMLVSRGGLILRGPGGELEVAKGGLEATAIARKLDEVQQVFPKMRLNVLPAADLTWRELAPVLIAAACGTDDPKAGRPARALWLALDEGALDERIKSQLAAGQASPKDPDPDDPGRLIGLDLKPKPGEVRMGPTLPREEIKRVIRDHQAEVRYCYERELIKDPNLAGKLVTNFTVGPHGKVTEATIKAGLNNEPLRECLVAGIRRWVFPEPLGGGIVNITYPFIFKAAD